MARSGGRPEWSRRVDNVSGHLAPDRSRFTGPVPTLSPFATDLLSTGLMRHDRSEPKQDRAPPLRAGRWEPGFMKHHGKPLPICI